MLDGAGPRNEVVVVVAVVPTGVEPSNSLCDCGVTDSFCSEEICWPNAGFNDNEAPVMNKQELCQIIWHTKSPERNAVKFNLNYKACHMIQEKRI